MLKIAMMLAVLMMPTFAQAETEKAPANAYDFSLPGADGKPVDLSQYAGKVVMVVNTATGCGFAGQFGELQKVYDTYKDKGFVLLAVPSNDFGGQEPLEVDQIAKQTGTQYGVTYPFMAKSVVSGDNAIDFYKWAAAQGKGGFLGNKPRWNFHKYLIGAHGELLGSYPATTSPLDKKVTADIETALLAVGQAPDAK